MKNNLSTSQGRDKLTVGYYYLIVKMNHLHEFSYISMNTFEKQSVQWKRQITKRYIYFTYKVCEI